MFDLRSSQQESVIDYRLSSVSRSSQSVGSDRSVDRDRAVRSPADVNRLNSQAVCDGWLIEGAPRPPEGRRHGQPQRRFLQIATGQWCSAEYATLFPLRRTAVAYAREFGLLLDPVVKIVRHGGEPGGAAREDARLAQSPLRPGGR